MIETKELAMKIANFISEKKGLDIEIINIAEKSSFADYFIITSVGSDRQLKALMDNIEEELEKEGIFPKNIEGRQSKEWVLMDYIDIVINIMTMETRTKYNFTKIWGDCDIINID